ncbi:GNAT family N-acetyltransferase [Kineosporia mesophila]|uniref:GNAT family N-acetyltransferase n=1 Tax=Kineosporia mesophila TaxID=566012 RepID=UPI001E4B10DC|nr:GNAT family N-acetyltransferase [Kineosporia mesophila]
MTTDETSRRRIVFRVLGVGWDDERARVLREAMSEEVGRLYADRGHEAGSRALSIQEDSVLYTGLAVTGDGQGIGHIALRRLRSDVEIKRMYVRPGYRGVGVAGALVDAVEQFARDHGERRIVLATGDRQPEAVGLYRKAGFTPIEIYPPYVHLGKHSKAFAKLLA